MGYELKMCIVDVRNNYAMIIAMVDLCKCCNKVNAVILKEKSDNGIPVYLYTSFASNEEKIIQDWYDDPLVAVSPIPILQVMEESYKEWEYRRYGIAIPMIKEAIRTFNKDTLKLVFFGH